MNRLAKRIPLGAWAWLLVMVPLAVKLACDWHRIPLPYGETIGPEDPDPWLRLSLVRDWLQGASWYDHTSAHSNAPYGGIASPWTRPLDVVIAFFTQLQPESVALDTRLIRSALMMPVLWMGLLLAGLMRNVRLLTPSAIAPFMVSALVASCLPMWNYFNAGNADHHALLAVLFVWALGGPLRTHPSPRHTLLSGLLLALALWVSPEVILLIAAIYGWYGLQWLAGDRVRAEPWVLLSLTLAAGTGAALMIERPPAAWGMVLYDTLSIVWVMLLALTAAGILLLQHVTPATLRGRLAMALLVGAAVLLAAWAMFPLIFHGPYAAADAYIFQKFLPRITETHSLLSAHPVYITAMLLQPLAALVILAMALDQRPSLFAPAHVLQLMYLVLVTSALYLFQQRYYYYFYPTLVLVIAPFCAVLFTPEEPALSGQWPGRVIGHLAQNTQALIRLPIVLALLGGPTLLMALEPIRSTDASRQISSCQHVARQLIYGGQLNGIGGGKPLTVFIYTDLGGEMLFFTPHRIIASNYHREAQGIQYIWQADNITAPGDLRTYLAARKVDLLVLCPTVDEFDDSILRRLRRGSLDLSWLERVPYTRAPLQAGEVRDEATDSPPVLLRVRPQQ